MRLQRVIVASDLNANYIQFWPLVVKVWTHIIPEIRLTLMLVCSDSKTQIDTFRNAEIIKITPPRNLPPCFVAQTVRLLAPVLYPKETCLIGDIDTVVTNRGFLTKYAAKASDRQLLVLNRYDSSVHHSSLAYHIGKGRLFASIFNLDSTQPRATVVQNIRKRILLWYKQFKGQWSTDELLLNRYVAKWSRAARVGRVVKYYVPGLWGGNHSRTVSNYHGFKFHSDPQRVLEVEMPFPYLRHRARIHAALKRVLPKLSLDSIRVTQRGVVRKNRHPHKPVAGTVFPRYKRKDGTFLRLRYVKLLRVRVRGLF